MSKMQYFIFIKEIMTFVRYIHKALRCSLYFLQIGSEGNFKTEVPKNLLNNMSFVGKSTQRLDMTILKVIFVLL